MRVNRLAAAYREGNEAITNAYKLGLEEGKRQGYEEEARDHHKWLLSHDERLAEVDAQARRMALLDAADAWEAGNRNEMHALAEKHYIAGGPSMPTIWLRLRAGEQRITPTPTPRRADDETTTGSRTA